MAVTGCGGADVTPPTEPSAGERDVSGVALETRTFRPAVPHALHYGEDSLQRQSPTERAVLRALGTQAKGHDPAMSAMARSLARAAPSAGEFPAGLVSKLLAWHGVPDPAPSVLVIETEDGGCARDPSPEACAASIGALVDEARASLPTAGDARVGVGADITDDGHGRIIIAYVERAVTLAPIPRVTSRGATVRVQGSLIGARHRPRLEVVDGDGQARRLPAVLGSDGSFDASFQCDARSGEVQVEVLCEGRHGVEVAANFPVQCGGRLPGEITYLREHVAGAVSPLAVAQRLFELTNEVRAARGLSPLSWSEIATDVALAHASDMVQAGFVGHVSPTTGSAIDRFESAQIPGSVIRENVARGYGPHEIHASLMESPGHRANILADDVTHVGIGVVLGAPETTADIAPIPIYVTQNFFLRSASRAPAALTQGLLKQVRTRRAAQGLEALEMSGGLTSLASQIAGRIATGQAPEGGYEQAAFALGFGEVVLHRAFSDDFVRLAATEVFGAAEAAPGAWGVAVARVAAGPHTGQYALVVLNGRR